MIVSVPALYDSADLFLDGTLIGIDSSSTVVGVESKPAGPHIPGYATTYVDTLRVADPQKGTYFLDLTLAEYEAILRTAGQSTNKEITTKYTIGASPVSVITDTGNLYNVTLNAIIIDGVALDISTVTYTPLTDSTITFATPIPATSVVQVIYNKN